MSGLLLIFVLMCHYQYGTVFISVFIKILLPYTVRNFVFNYLYGAAATPLPQVTPLLHPSYTPATSGAAATPLTCYRTPTTGYFLEPPGTMAMMMILMMTMTVYLHARHHSTQCPPHPLLLLAWQTGEGRPAQPGRSCRAIDPRWRRRQQQRGVGSRQN